MKKILKITLIFLILIAIKISSNLIINSIAINQYSKGNYNTNLIKPLYFINIFDSYLPYYNEGNFLYQNGKYNEAIDKYNEALKHHPQNKVCDIRINLSLSYLATTDLNDCEKTPEILKKSKSILTEDNCLINSDEAKKLANEIKNIEEKLEKNCDSGSSGDSGEDSNEDPSDSNQNSNDEQKEKEIEEKLKEQQKESMISRDDDMEYIENELKFNYDEGRW